jgi:hypothetical protein
MTTAAWSSQPSSTNDTTYRQAGSELSARLATVGLVQTADTGQINWATVTWPPNNTVGGYEIWRFNDALQGTNPIFIKINYGTGNSSSPYPLRLTVQVGQGSNGSGTLTGTLSAANVIQQDNNPVGTSAVNSYLCHVAGFLGLSWKASIGFFAIIRTCDVNGNPVAGGYFFVTRGSNAPSCRQTAYNYVTNTNTVSNVSLFMTVCPGNIGSTLTGGLFQAYPCWSSFPDARVMFGIFGAKAAEFGEGATVSFVFIGSTSRSYISVTGSLVESGLSVGMLYE